MNITLREFLESLQLPQDNFPEDWINGFDAAVSAYPENGPVFLSEAYIKEWNSFLRLDKDKLELLLKAADMISNSEVLRLFAWLWYYLAFVDRKKDSPFSKWPLPAAFPEPVPDMFHAVVLMGALPDMKKRYQDKGIPLEVFVQTLSDINVNMGDYHFQTGRYGIGPGWFSWLNRHINGGIYRLERLQFVPSSFSHDDIRIYRNKQNRQLKVVPSLAEQELDCVPSGVPDDSEWELLVCKGTPILEVHIPSGAPMLPDECRKSYEMARRFFPEYFPQCDFKAFTCGSWLLSPQLRAILPPTSNIAPFYDEYTLFKMTRSESYFERVFGSRLKDTKAEDLPEDTSLRRVCKNHILNGGVIYSAHGVIAR